MSAGLKNQRVLPECREQRVLLHQGREHSRREPGRNRALARPRVGGRLRRARVPRRRVLGLRRRVQGLQSRVLAQIRQAAERLRRAPE